MRACLFIILSFYCLSCDNERERGSSSKTLDKPEIVASIDYSYQGCFGGGKSRLEIVEQKGERVAQVIENNQIVATAKFNSSRSKVFEEFITELKRKKFGFGCTTTAYYSVANGTDKFEKEDGSCDWDGFENLRKSLFNE